LKKSIEILCTVLLFFATYWAYSGQERISLNQGHGWDGEHYYQAALQVSEGQSPIVAQTPFVNRIGLCYAVGTYARIFNKSILTSAFHINALAILLTTILLHLWLWPVVTKAGLRLLFILLYLLVWHSGIRNLFFDSIVPDPWGAFFFLSGLLLMRTIKRKHQEGKSLYLELSALSLVVFVGLLFRESNAVIALALPFIINPFSRSKDLLISAKNGSLKQWKEALISIIRELFSRHNRKLLLPLLAILAAKVFSLPLLSTINHTGYSYPQALVTNFYNKSLPEFLLGCCLAYGPLWLLLPFYWRSIKTFLSDKEELTIVLFFGVFFGYFGGGDTERILFMSTFPLVFIFLSFAVEELWKKKKSLIVLLLVLQSLAYRLFWHLPDFPNDYTQKPLPLFAMLGEHFPHLYLYSSYGNIYLNTLLLIEYALLFLVLFFWQQKLALKR